MIRHFKVRGRVGMREGATVTIKPVAGGFLFMVRPSRSTMVSTLSLTMVADMVVWRVAKLEQIQVGGTGPRRRGERRKTRGGKPA
jgi:hypothetical protein